MAQKTAYPAMLTDEKIQSLRLKHRIRDILQNEFSAMKITDVDLRGDEDFDGDPILRVYISYIGDLAKTPGSRATALNKIRDSLENDNDSSFPVMTFIRERNVKKKGRIA